MSIRLLVSGRDARQLKSAEAAIRSAFTKAERILASDREVLVNLIPSSNPDIRRYMGGASGWTRSEDTVDIYIDAKAPTWKEATQRSLIHEFNHVIRAQRFKKPFEDYTLLDTIAFEGLAQCFEKEILGTLPSYARAISLGQARELWLRLKPHLQEIDSQFYRRVFFATKDREFPHWTGYTISYIIVRRRMSTWRFGWSRIMREEPCVIIGQGLG